MVGPGFADTSFEFHANVEPNFFSELFYFKAGGSKVEGMVYGRFHPPVLKIALNFTSYKQNGIGFVAGGGGRLCFSSAPLHIALSWISNRTRKFTCVYRKVRAMDYPGS